MAMLLPAEEPEARPWRESRCAEAERRGLARDVARDEHGSPQQAVAFWHEWQGEELPFPARDRSWERARVGWPGRLPGPATRGRSSSPRRPGPR